MIIGNFKVSPAEVFLMTSVLLAGILSTPTLADTLSLKQVARHSHNIFDESAAEIVAYHPQSRTSFVVNSAAPSVDILRFDSSADKYELTLKGQLILEKSESPTSVDIFGDLLAVAVHDEKTAGRPGKVILFKVTGERVQEIKVGSLPDMVTFTPDGKYILTANEGEPHGNMDPEGSISIIDLSGGPAYAKVRTADFKAFDTKALKEKGVRIFPGKTAAQDLEPEYIAPSKDSRFAFVTLQENNAIARVDIAKAEVSDIFPLGVKDHSKPGQGLDPNDKDGINIAPYPVVGLYMPDAIAAYEANGRTYLVTANEGDARDEDIKLGEARINPQSLTSAQAKKLAKLRISKIDGDLDGDGRIDVPHAYGARSFSIWSDKGELIFDSGDQFEQITAEILGQNFNHDNKDPGSGDKRSDNKGPEPEGVAIGEINGRSYAFIGLERVGGIMVYDITNPEKPRFMAYENNRNFTSTLNYENPRDLMQAGDMGPEGLIFIAADKSPTGLPMLLVASETSGSVTAYNIEMSR